MKVKLFLVAVGALLLAFAAGTVTKAEPARAATTSSLRAIAPAQVQVGEPVRITLEVRGAADIGGYETNLLFDKGAAEFAGLTQLNKDLTMLGRDVGSLGPVEQPWGASIGAFSCPVEECARPGTGSKSERGSGGAVELATITVLPNRAGRLEFKLAATKFVDATGKAVQVGAASKSFTVQVGPRKTTTSHTAPGPVSWSLKSTSPSPSVSSDTTGDGEVTHADAMEVALAWTMLRESGSACGAAVEDPSQDVNGDGCVDVADAQTVVAKYDTRASTDVLSGVQRGNGASDFTLSAASLLLDWISPRPAFAQATSTFTVNSTADGADANAGDGVCATSEDACTLRAAIEETNLHPGADTIAFNIPGTGTQTITLGSTLPTINDETGPTTIDGYTQPGASPNTDDSISNAKIMVQITTPTAYPSGIYGLTVSSPGNTIRGLAVFKIRKGIWLYGANSTNNTIAGDFIGTDAAGGFGATTYVDEGEGIAVQNQASGNDIGVASPGGRNVVSGSARRGIALFSDSNSNRIVNNIVGLGPAGDKRLANLRIGIDLNLSSVNNQIGGLETYERNVISGNGWQGVELSHGATVTGNRIVGNFIGTDATGNTAPAYTSHERWGVQIEDRPSDNLIADNVIGNSSTQGGILLANSANKTQVRGNRIGISRDGRLIPNARSGVQVDGISGLPSKDSRIGPNNVVANNGLDGVRIVGEHSDRHTVTRNSIFGNGGLGIDLTPLGAPNPNDADDADTGPNQQLNFPRFEVPSSREVAGTACKGCTVEVFVADSGASGYGEGKTFAGSTVASADGRFSVAMSGASSGDYVSATATDTTGNTSEFSPNQVVPADTTAPTPPTGLTATASSDGVSLDWIDNAESDLQGYSVYRSTTRGGPYTKTTLALLPSSAYTDKDVAGSTTYYYTVTATDKADNESGISNEASATTPEATVPSTALSFDGINDGVSVPTSTLLNKSAANERTYELKIKTGANVNARQFVYEEGGGTNGYSIEIEGGRLYFNAWSDSKGWGTVSASAAVSPDTIYHVAGVHDQPSGQVHLYLNSVLQQSSAGADTMSWHQDGIALGGIRGSTRAHTGTSSSSGSYFGGLIDEFRAWNVARTQTQIQNDMDADLTGSESNLIVLYKIDEGNGTVVNDSTANNLDGAIDGASWSSM